MSNIALATAGLVFSEQTDALLPKLLEVKQQMNGTGVKKNAKNRHLGNSYSDINAIVEAVEPVLTEVGLLSMTASRVDTESRIVNVDTTIMHAESGQWVCRSSSFEVANLAAQAVAGCETYGRRYNHTGLFNLRAEDDDGNVATSAAPQGGKRPPSAKALKFAETMASERGVEVPDEVRSDGKLCSKFIDDLKQMPKDHQANASNEGNGTSQATSDAFNKAADYITAAKLAELPTLWQQVKEHKVLSDSEKDRLCDLLKQREKNLAA